MLLVALIIAVIMLLVKLVLRGMHKLELTRRDFIPVAVLGVLFGVGQVPFVKEMLSFSKIKLLPAVTIAVIGVILWQVYKIIKKRSQPGFNLTKTIGVIVLAAVLYALTYIKSIEFVLKMVSFPILPCVNRFDLAVQSEDFGHENWAEHAHRWAESDCGDCFGHRC